MDASYNRRHSNESGWLRVVYEPLLAAPFNYFLPIFPFAEIALKHHK